MIELFVDWTLKNNLLLIEILIFLILLSGFLLVLREVHSRRNKGKGKSDGLTIDQIQQALKDVLGKAENVSQIHEAAHSGAKPASEPLMEEIQLLRTALSEKDAEMQALRDSAGPAAAAGAGGAAASADTKLLESQIAELQAKLQEYDIISEDIADLAKFKSENLKLREELNVFKGEIAPPAAAEPAPPSGEKVS